MKIFLFTCNPVFFIIITAAIYQRENAQTNLINSTGTIQLVQKDVNFKLARFHAGFYDHEIIIKANNYQITDRLYNKRTQRLRIE